MSTAQPGEWVRRENRRVDAREQLRDEVLTNPQIGAELLPRPADPEWHLRNVFTKLGISCWRELRDALLERRTVAAV